MIDESAIRQRVAEIHSARGVLQERQCSCLAWRICGHNPEYITLPKLDYETLGDIIAALLAERESLPVKLGALLAVLRRIETATAPLRDRFAVSGEYPVLEELVAKIVAELCFAERQRDALRQQAERLRECLSKALGDLDCSTYEAGFAHELDKFRNKIRAALRETAP